jgi:hypothetical protein
VHLIFIVSSLYINIYIIIIIIILAYCDFYFLLTVIWPGFILKILFFLLIFCFVISLDFCILVYLMLIFFVCIRCFYFSYFVNGTI